MDASITAPPRWWQTGVIYQIYPRSFQDSNGDGIGDLPGILSRLDYLHWLGVNALWLSPIFPSPMADFGYDVSNHTDIHPLFGTLEDFDALLTAAHRLRLKVLLDYVPNHTSDQHPWFLESRSSRANPRRAWYLWRDPGPDGAPPNNWRSVFGGGAWHWDEHTGQYYLHTYLKEQPDLNWRNPDVQQAMLSVLRFWLDRGVDGFRVDAVSRLIKDAAWRDDPPNPDYTPGQDPYTQLLPTYSRDQPELRDVIRRMRQVLDEYDDRMMIGEAYLPLPRLLPYYEAGFHFPFNFQLVRGLAWQPAVIGPVIDAYEGLLAGLHWPNWVLGNHDNPRVATRAGLGRARVAAMLLLTLRGTPTLYYGDEIGMRDVHIQPAAARDPWEKNVPGQGRDPARTPMQWEGGPHAGFTTGAPWLPIAEDYPQVNVATLRRDPGSLLSLYRRLLSLRATEPALQTGRYAPVLTDERVLAYRREQFVVVLNFASESITVNHTEVQGQITLSTVLDREGETVSGALRLRGDEGVIICIR
jgi:alpha-glucosidase